MTTILNASPSNGLVQAADGSGVIKVQSNGVTTNALAWCNFNGTLSTPITPRSNYNIGSVTKSATGVYILNFTTAQSDANYSAVVGGTYLDNSAGQRNFLVTTQAFSTSSLRIYAVDPTSGSAVDMTVISVAIFGN